MVFAVTLYKNMSQQRILLGKAGEEKIVEYLVSNGFTLIARNYRQSFGEIDIIAQKDYIIAFVEVKLRLSAYGSISDLVPIGKQKKIIKTAQFFIASTYTHREHIYRFDVAFLEQKNGHYVLTYIPDAFRKE